MKAKSKAMTGMHFFHMMHRAQSLPTPSDSAMKAIYPEGLPDQAQVLDVPIANGLRTVGKIGGDGHVEIG